MNVKYVNKKKMTNNNFVLRKIAVGLGLASAIIITTNFMTNRDIDDVKERFVTESNMDEFDKFETDIITTLQDYENSYKTYQDNPSVENRVNLVSETKYLRNIANQIIEEKINNAMETSANIDIVEVTGGERAIVADDQIVSNNIPSGLNDLVNKKDFIETEYKGDGSSDAWTNEMKNYNKKGLDLYKAILNNLDTNYSYDGDSFKVSKETAKSK